MLSKPSEQAESSEKLLFETSTATSGKLFAQKPRLNQLKAHSKLLNQFEERWIDLNGPRSDLKMVRHFAERRQRPINSERWSTFAPRGVCTTVDPFEGPISISAGLFPALSAMFASLT